LFADRRDAGRRLAGQLHALAPADPVVIALPRGGVPVGDEIARALGAPLDVLVVRKLGAPGDPELGVGAIAEGGATVVDSAGTQRAGMSRQALDATIQTEARELRRRVWLYRAGRAAVDVTGRTVVVVDDGLATGLTALVAVRALRARGAASIVVAVPVGIAAAVDLLRAEADAVLCHTTPARLLAVGHCYEDFAPVSDAEVVAILAGGEDPRDARADPPRRFPDS